MTINTLCSQRSNVGGIWKWSTLGAKFLGVQNFAPLRIHFKPGRSTQELAAPHLRRRPLVFKVLLAPMCVSQFQLKQVSPSSNPQAHASVFFLGGGHCLHWGSQFVMLCLCR